MRLVRPATRLGRARRLSRGSACAQSLSRNRNGSSEMLSARTALSSLGSGPSTRTMVAATCLIRDCALHGLSLQPRERNEQRGVHVILVETAVLGELRAAGEDHAGVDCVFRAMPATDSEACRASVPGHVGPPFRSMP